MTLESFIDIHKDDSHRKKLAVLVDTLELVANARLNRQDAFFRRNHEDAAYYGKECQHMNKRAEWLYGELLAALEDKTG